MHQSMQRTVVLCAMVGLAPLTIIAAQVTLTDVDGTSLVGEFVALSPGEIIWKADGDERTTSLADLARIRFHRRLDTSRVPDPCLAFPKSGGRVSGAILETMPDGFIMRTRFAKRLKLPFASLRAITFEKEGWPPEVLARYESALTGARPGEDLLLARSEKAADGVREIPGILLELGPTSGEFRFNDRSRRVRLEKIFALVFAASLEEPPGSSASMELSSGEVFTGSLSSIEDDLISFATHFDEVISCSLDEVESLTLNSDRIVYLDSLEPHSHTSSGMVQNGWMFRKNRNVFNQPMRMDAVEYEHGIGVHAHSEIQFRLGGRYETFAATIGIDDGVRPGGHVRFKVIVDGSVAYDGEPMTGADRATPISVPVSGAEWMTLIVETADHADIGDWANWAAARLIKPKSQS